MHIRLEWMIAWLRNHRMRSLVVANRPHRNGRIVIWSLKFESMNTGLAGIFFVADCWWHAVQLQSRASCTRPRVRGCGIALDLSPPAPLTCPHNLQSLVPVMLVDEDIICYISLACRLHPKHDATHSVVAARHAAQRQRLRTESQSYGRTAGE